MKLPMWIRRWDAKVCRNARLRAPVSIFNLSLKSCPDIVVLLQHQIYAIVCAPILCRYLRILISLSILAVSIVVFARANGKPLAAPGATGAQADSDPRGAVSASVRSRRFLSNGLFEGDLQ